MGTWVWCELVCDHCSRSAPEGQFVSEDRIPRAALRKAAASEGWIFNEDGRAFCCEEHQRAFDKEK